MPQKQAVVSLYPLYQLHPLPFRSLTFTSNLDSIKIGRASKREAKNLAPACNNALFDSRVMSRNHARLRVSLDEKVVYIRDGGSMHGTCVNGRKIPVERDVTIKSGDVVTFGAEVTRGKDTHMPVMVRCECQWLDVDEKTMASNTGNEQQTYKSNTFCVPDDDDDDEEIEIADGLAPMDSPSSRSYEQDTSNPSSDCDNQQTVETSTPMTTPPKKETPTDLPEQCLLATSSLECLLNGSQRRPLALDGGNAEQPLVTPRMTPPTVEDTCHCSYAGSPHSIDDGIDYASDVEPVLSTFTRGHSITGSDYWEENEGQDGSGDEVSELSPYMDTDGLDQAADPVAGGNCVPPNEYEVLMAAAHEPSQSQNNGWVPALNDAPCPVVSIRDDNSSIGAVASSSTPSQSPTKTVSLQSHWSAIPDSHGVTNATSHPSEELLSHPLPCFHYNPSVPRTESWPPARTLYTVDHGHPISSAPYSDGPFVNNHLQTSFGKSESDNGAYSSVVAPEVVDEPGQRQCHDSQNICPIGESNHANPQSDVLENASTHGPRVTRESNTRVSIADIVDTSVWVPVLGENQSRKRKFSDMESDSEESLDENLETRAAHGSPIEMGDPLDKQSTKGLDTEFFSQDAQPQESPCDLDVSHSHLTGLHTVAESQATSIAGNPAVEKEPPLKKMRLSTSGGSGSLAADPSKKPRTRSRGGFKSHAASALIGAVVGGLGTVAFLASLPTDYFA